MLAVRMVNVGLMIYAHVIKSGWQMIALKVRYFWLPGTYDKILWLYASYIE